MKMLAKNLLSIPWFWNMRFVAADIRTKPFAKGFFDEIFFAGTAHHVSDELLPEILRELHHTLKVGGILHVIDPVYRAKDGWSAKLIRRFDQGKFTRTPERILKIVTSLDLFEIGTPAFHVPYGALLQDCDFMHFPLKKCAK